MPEGGAFTNQIQTEWMCYNCFVLWCVSGSKALIACVWHEERFYTAGLVPRNGVDDLADGKPWVSMPLNWNVRIYHSDSHNLSCVRTLYKRMFDTFDTTNQLATRIICTKHALNYG